MPLYPPASAGGGGYNLVKEEGAAQTARTTLAFVGAGVTASDVGGETQISVPGGGSPSSTTIETNLGSTPLTQGKFTITDAAINTSSKVLVWQAPGPYTGKGTVATDEGAMDRIHCIAIAGTGSAVVYWETLPMLTFTTDPKVGGDRSTLDTYVGAQLFKPNNSGYARRLGRVKGNVKFTYMVLG